ncbi:MAG: flagellar basal body P-ring formation chaperone FlgA [Pseudomonadota bacterium]
MKFSFTRLICGTVLGLAVPLVLAQEGSPPTTSTLKTTARAFLEQQLAGQAGEVRITVKDPDSRIKISACNQLEPFLPNGSKLTGRTLVGIRCLEPSPWQLHMLVDIRISATIWVANRPLSAKSLLKQSDLRQETLDITNYPTVVITKTEQVVGKTLNRSIPAGMPIRLDALQSEDALAAGDVVRVECIGQGFKVTSEGKVLSNANSGQTVQVRTSSGQVVTGTARPGKTVEVRI